MKKQIFIILGILLLAIATFFITYEKDSTSNLTKIRVAEVAHSVFYAPMYSAVANNYFEEEGINIEIILTPGADNVTAAVLSGDVEIGFSGSEATIYVYNGGEKDYLKTFAQLTQKDGSFIVSREKNDNFKLTDLIGKDIIGGRKGGMPEMTLEWVLKENGIDPKTDVNIDTSVAFAAMAGAFIGGQGDYVALFEPQATTVESQGFGYVVASLGSLGGVVPYTAFNARISFIEENKDTIEAFTRAIQKGLDYVHNTDSEKVAEAILEFFPDTSLNSLITVINRYKANDTWPQTTTFTEESFDHLQNIMISAGELKSKVNYNDLIYVR